MPIHDLGFRGWEGDRTPPWAKALVIAQTGVALAFKNPWLRRAMVLAWFPAVYFGVAFFFFEQTATNATDPSGMMLLSILSGFEPRDEDWETVETLRQISPRRFPGNRIRPPRGNVPPPTGAVPPGTDGLGDGQSEEALREIQSGQVQPGQIQPGQLQPDPNRPGNVPPGMEGQPKASSEEPAPLRRGDLPDFSKPKLRHMYWSMLLMLFLGYLQGVLMVLVVGMIAPQLITRDIRTRGYLIYFCRPLTTGEYMVGKLAIIWSYLAMITVVPGFALYLVGVSLSPNLEVIFHTWDLPLRVIAASLVMAIPASLIALAFSAVSSETRYAGFAWFAFWILGWVAYSVMSNLPTKIWFAFAFSGYHSVRSVQSWVFGINENMTEVGIAASLLVTACVVSIIIIARRVAAPLRM